MTDAGVATARGEAGGKGLRAGALGMMSGIVIGVASTAPGYSLAASLGLVVAAVGLQAPAIMFLALAEEHDAAMIVVGTHSERPLLGVVLGSTAYKLLHRSTIPVLVVPSRPG